MSNGMKFREQPKQNNSDEETFGTNFGTNQDPVMRFMEEKSKAEQEAEGKKKNSGKSSMRGRQKKSETHGERGSTSGTGPPGQKNRPTGGGQDDEFNRVVGMLESIRKGIEPLVKTEIAGVPKEVDSELRDCWPRVEESFKTSIAALQNRKDRPRLRTQLEASGFVGDMLEMKETSLKYQMERLDKAILTYSKDKTKLEKFVTWIKPSFKAMKSILGSLRGIPGVEVIKEFIEHLESLFETVETGQVE